MYHFKPFPPFLTTWLTFALAAVPVTTGSIWATVRTTSLMTDIAFAEWAILTVSLTVVGCITQIGFKPGYMQEVTDIGKEKRNSVLFSSTIALVITGFLGGIFLQLIFTSLYFLSYWENLSAIYILPIYCLINNAIMMFHTDLRILGQAKTLAWLSILQIPLFIIFLEIFLYLNFDPLASFFTANSFSSFILLIYLFFLSGISIFEKFNLDFIKRACLMGTPVMGGLLSRYCSDLVVVATFRWAMNDQIAGIFGVASRLCEPLLIIYIGSFQMAWGSHVYNWIKKSPSGEVVSKNSSFSWFLVVLGIPIGFGIAIAIKSVSFSETELGIVLIFTSMLISRILAFGLSSSMGYGQTMERSYRNGFKIHFSELIFTITLLPFFAVYIGLYQALFLCSVLPWISVLRLRSYSLKIRHSHKLR